MIKKVAIIFILIIFIDGCKKYPEDEHIHMFTASGRLCRTPWRVRKFENLTSQTFSFGLVLSDLPVIFNKNGTCSGGDVMSYIDGNGINHNGSYIFNFNGTWEFIEHKTKIKITNNSYHYTVWQIFQLDRSTLAIASDSIKYYFKEPKFK